MHCEAEFKGVAKLPCDRCLEPVELTLAFSERLIVQLGELTDTDEEIWTLGPECHELDLSQPVFEWLHLNLPSRRLHDTQDECDPEIMEFLVSWIKYKILLILTGRQRMMEKMMTRI